MNSTSPITNLDSLLAALQEGQFENDNDWSQLPTFGGNEPRDTSGVWSWDETRVLVGDCASELKILQRDDENAWWN